MLYKSIAQRLDAMSGLTRLHFSLYDDKQQLIASSSKQDAMLSALWSNSKARAIYNEFIDRQLKAATLRINPFTVQGITGQYYAFIPVHYEGRSMTIMAEAFYLSEADFRRFYHSDSAQALGVKERSEVEWLKDICICSHEEIADILEHIASIHQTLLTSHFDNKRLRNYFQQSKAIIGIISDLKSDYALSNIYNIVVESVIFMFEVDTAAIFVSADDGYYPKAMEGRKKRLMKALRLPADNKFITELTAAEESFLTMTHADLLRFGFPEEISRMALFPINCDQGLLGLLAIIDTHLDNTICQSINNLINLTTCLFEIKHKQEALESRCDQLTMHSIQSSSLHSLCQERLCLYEGIVSEAANLAGAEKCSLMLSQDKEILEVRAARGSTSFLKSVRVRKGEGIAGKVYEQGQPALVNGADELMRYGSLARPHYKTMSLLSLPLKVADEIIGVLNFSDKSSGASFTQRDISLLSPFILQVSAILKLGICRDDLDELKKITITDSMTSLFNRRYFDVRLEEEFLRAKRYGLTLSLAIMDIDDFKLFNDTEGHIAGDSILKEVAHIMAGSVRSHDILTRFGGEEFAIIMPQTSKAEAMNVSERIRENIKRDIRPSWETYHKKQMTICSGIATFPECGMTKEGIIICADKALYRAKSLGKDRTICWK